MPNLRDLSRISYTESMNSKNGIPQNGNLINECINSYNINHIGTQNLKSVSASDISVQPTYYLIKNGSDNSNSFILTINPPEGYHNQFNQNSYESNYNSSELNNCKINKNDSSTNKEEFTSLNQEHIYSPYSAQNVKNLGIVESAYCGESDVLQLKENDSSNSMNKRRFSAEPRICTHCNRLFKYPSDLKKHIQIHSQEKKYNCVCCGRSFRRQHQLNVHARIHTGEKPYVCNICGISFRHDSTLTMHTRTRHQRLKPFKCEICEKMFGRLSHLRKHQKYVCATARKCSGTFETNSDNSRQTTFACEKCNIFCYDETAFSEHLLICESNLKNEDMMNMETNQYSFISNSMTRQEMVHCDVCEKSFSSSDLYEHHMITVHRCEYSNNSFERRLSSNDNLFKTLIQMPEIESSSTADITQFPYPLCLSSNTPNYGLNSYRSSVDYQVDRNFKETDDSVAHIESIIKSEERFNDSYQKPLS